MQDWIITHPTPGDYDYFLGIIHYQAEEAKGLGERVSFVSNPVCLSRNHG